MPKAGKRAYYAVHKGRECRVFDTWEECEAQIKGFPNAKFKKFGTFSDADEYVRFGGASPNIGQAAPQKQSSVTTRTSSTSLTKPIPIVNNESESESLWDVVYCDGACSRNGTPDAVAGIGVWWGNNDPRNIHERCPGDQTNNRAELIALIRVLEEAPIGQKPLLIKTDSKYTIQCVTVWLHSWRKKNWKTSQGADVKNKPLIEYISALLALRSQCGQKVKLEHVYGHVGIEGNEGADRQANLGALQPTLPDRDWASSTKETIQKTESIAAGVKLDDAKTMTEPVITTESAGGTLGTSDLEIYDNDLLDEEELIQMGLTQQFD